MIGTLELFRLNLTPDNTMFFASKDEQTEWFNERVEKTIENISFNGSRPFRLSANYLQATFDYNYCRYKFGDRYVYAFIENIEYLNDNTSQLKLSIDMTQTFLEELRTAIVQSNIDNSTEKDSYFKKFVPFTNKMTPSDFNSYNLGNLTNNNFDTWVGGFMLINLDPLAVFPNSKIANVTYGLTDNGLPTSVMCLALPLIYNKQTRTLSCPQYFGTSTQIAGAGSLPELLDNVGAYIVDGGIGVTFESIGGLSFVDQNTILNSHNLVKFDGIQWNFINIVQNNTTQTYTFNLAPYIQSLPLPLRRNPYIYIRVGNDSESIELNLLDFYNDIEMEEDTMILEIEKFTSCLFPFTNVLRFKYNGREITDRNRLFSLISSDTVPFSVSAWNEYYSSNKATVNDGLATQQAYQQAQLRNNLGTSLINTGIDTISGGITWTKKLQQVSARSFKNQRATWNMASTGASGILGAMNEYANSQLEMQKDKALQQIGFNDIKSSPSMFSNLCSSITAKYKNGIQGIEVDIYIAKNIEDIKNYHKQYGYSLNRMQDAPFNKLKKHLYFDYISFNMVTIKMPFSQTIIAQLEELLESGIRFWYDYDHFLDFEIENSEVV